MATESEIQQSWPTGTAYKGLMKGTTTEPIGTVSDQEFQQMQALWNDHFADVSISEKRLKQLVRQWRCFGSDMIIQAMQVTVEKIDSGTFRHTYRRDEGIAQFTRGVLNNLRIDKYETNETEEESQCSL
jgi:hypothetical protein